MSYLFEQLVLMNERPLQMMRKYVLEFIKFEFHFVISNDPCCLPKDNARLCDVKKMSTRESNRFARRSCTVKTRFVNEPGIVIETFVPIGIDRAAATVMPSRGASPEAVRFAAPAPQHSLQAQYAVKIMLVIEAN